MSNGPGDFPPPSEDPMRMEQPPEEIDGLRLFERPEDAEMGRIVYQGDERPTFAERKSAAHIYWFIKMAKPREWRLTQAIATFERRSGYDTHIERLVGKYTSNREALDALTERSGEALGDTVITHYDDGSIRFVPPFSKDEAAYRSPVDDTFDRTHDVCATCVHYVPGHGCHFVQGEIDPGAYCEEFYANYGVFAHSHGDKTEVNAELMGGEFDWSTANVSDFVDEIEGRLRRAVRGRDKAREGDR